MLASVCVSACECSRLCASVCVSRLLVNARVCVRLSSGSVYASTSTLASVCVCSRQRFRMRARLCASVCVSRLSRVCMRLASVCVYSRVCVCVCVSRLLVNAYGNWLIFMRLPASVVLSRVCMRLLSRLYASTSTSARVCVRLCASLVWLSLCVCMRLASGSVYASVCVSRLLVNAYGNWLIFMRRSSCLASYYPLAVSYNVLMLKYPSHHLIYVFCHPMPIMLLY